ncbi:MAG: GNAT family N-acetyltransferase [Anaerolineae bacterium]|jgi:ribosomal protein S18 acetylase RimI-like enzyme
MELSIRAATPDDLAALDALFLEGDAWHAAHEATVFRVPTGEPRPHDYLRGIISADDSTILVAERQGEVLGMLLLLIRGTPDLPMMAPRRIGIIDTLIVVARARRQGIARRLMLAGEEWFAARDCVDLQLTVWDFNVGAQALYRQLGYAPQNRRLAKRLGAAPAHDGD